MEKGFVLGASQLARKKEQNFFNSPDNTLAIYTASRLLSGIGDRFGLQGMDVYLKNYIRAVDEQEPKLKAAVDQVVRVINIENMYHEAMNN
ncbi:MAG: hypothetical protein COW13_01755 [Candidatus Omnitrophica bacterium CG12_big_fil_rev_8_21_14_0_65_50_5]|nr:MAG: hypothetical protein COW13_01755 [Candidatus Omnitrophica bacterium CG12_big_fil_rev_8_21_14_0_65_50_5]